MSSTDDPIAVITREQLRGAVDELHVLADKLNEFRLGNSTAWTDEDTLRAYSLVTIIQSHVGITRTLLAAGDRTGTVVRLDDRR